MTKNKPLLLLTIGLFLMGSSVFWEYVRLRPDFRFVIRPWSMRGYEFSQGYVILAASLSLIALAWLLVRGVIKESRAHAIGVALFVILFAVAAGLLSDARDTEMPMVGSGILALIGMGIVGTYISRFTPENLPGSARRAIAVFGRLAAFLILLFFVLHPLIGGSPHPAWFVLLVVFAILAAIAVVRPPVALAPWRTLINSVVAVWVMTITMGASLRADLARAQFEINQVSADLPDIQVTSGVLIAWAGGLIAFVGAVGLWAKRRDEIAARDRARKQQMAARESEQQLAEQPA